MKVNFNPAISKSASGFSALNEQKVLIPSIKSDYNITNLNDMKTMAGQSQVNFHGNDGLTPPVSRILETEATKRIRGDYKWPEISDIKALMISAETQTFMKVGGLAEVAVQLPDEFNKKMAGSPNNIMQILTPLYSINNDKDLTLKAIDESHFEYSNGKNKIQLEKVYEYPVETFDKIAQKYTTENVGVLVGEKNGTDYIFLQNDKYFDLTPKKKAKPNGPYITAVNEVTSIERMLFLSKAVYQLMKNNVKAPVKGFETPNVVISNDWHISPLSAMMRFLAPIENSDGRLDSKTYNYFKNTPIIHITHNATYTGRDSAKNNDLLKMILGTDVEKIAQNVKGYMDKGSPFYNEVGEYCAGFSDTYTADRIVAVSPHYADEISTSKIMSGGQNKIHRLRQNYGTMLGIINGYTKSSAEPNEKMVTSINSALKPSTPFLAFDHMYNDEGYKIKIENKVKAITLLNQIAQKALAAEPAIAEFESQAKQEFENGTYKTKEEKDDAYENYQKSIEKKCKEIYGDFAPGVTKLIQPADCKIESEEDMSKIPFIASVGRVTNQKGFDILAASVKNIITNLNPWDERPIVAILGCGEPTIMEELKNLKKEVAEFDPIAASRIFVFDGFSGPLRDALGIGSDFFLIPSKWEPCGLTQMESMPKGSIPVTTATGGLVDTIVDGEEGFLTDVFYANYTNRDTKEVTTEKIFDNGKIPSNEIPADNIEAFTITLQRALDTYYNDPEKIKQMSINGMIKNFSWDIPNGPLEDYIKLMRTGSVTG